MNIESFVMIGQKTVRLMSSVILSAETPVNAWENVLIFEANCAEDTAAYSFVPFSRGGEINRKDVYTFLVQFQLKSMEKEVAAKPDFATAKSTDQSVYDSVVHR